ncbi:hypothetical protein KC19_12G021600 [Ceratodon purpureus]|uniref:Ribosome-recycling factor, chloroplastic n=1 Tax=Ceratodon purpureus TaxID=3225 RepID=A0A8T0G644_CERPU|nr:hypothetical protein KC19_12G021600 [Ceratodon purpureus]
MAASVRRLRQLGSSLSSLSAPRTFPSTSRIVPCIESSPIDQSTSLERTSSRISEVLASVSPSSISASQVRSQRTCGVESELPVRFVKEGNFRVLGGFKVARSGGWCEGLGVGDRGFAAKAKKSGGKARDDGGSQMLANSGPSAKETATRLMEAALNALSVELSKLRTGRASPGMLDHVNVMAHGVQTPLSHVAAVSVSSLETLTVMPYESSMVKEVEKAIRNSPLKLNPMEEGEVLRVPIPKLTKEHIQTMSKLVGKAGETAKLSVRRARKDAMDIIAKGGFSKDEVKRSEKEVEEVTKKYVKAVEDSCKSKEKEILGNS